MAFFRNSTVNLLNLHYAVHSLALSGGGAFFAVFLLQAHVPAPAVLAALAAILIGRFCVRPLVLVFAHRWGLKPLVVAGTIITGLQYPLLAEVHGIGPSLYLLCVVSSLGDTLYWTCYHAYFAALGDPEHRGHQIGAREAVAAIVGIVGPLVTGWALTALGPRIAFDATAVVILLAALPILGTPNVAIVREKTPVLKEAWSSVLMFTADGWSNSAYGMVWQIALFLALGRSFTAFGGAMAFAAVVGAACGLLLGRWIDRGHGRKGVWLAIGSAVLCVVMRAGGYGDPILAVLANASGALVVAFYVPTEMTAVYNRAQRSSCTLRFHIACEAGFDVGGAASLLTSAALLAAGAPLWSAILMALIGVAAMYVLLSRYYAGEGRGLLATTA
jgi:MFS transporter, DHA1 family, inner membrane transport protein